MRCKCLVVWLGLGVLFGEVGIKQPVEVTNTERVDFAPGGVIRMDHSYGTLNIEGWDQPVVEITVTKSLGPDYAPERRDEAKRRLESVRVVAERKSDTELTIATILAHRRGVLLDYEIHVPRDTRLVIHHGKGLVSVNDVTGSIEATVSSGDIVLMLADADPRTIDAKCRMGRVDSDFAGAEHIRYLIGERFDRAGASSPRRIYLHARYGGITIKQSLPESEAPVASRRP